MLFSMKGRDDKGYPLQGVDVVPERKGLKPGWKLFWREEDFRADKIEYCVSRLVELMKEANKRADKYKDQVDILNRKYNLHDEYLALKYSDICDECEKVSDSAIPGKTYTLCQAWVSKESWRKSENKQEISFKFSATCTANYTLFTIGIIANQTLWFACCFLSKKSN